MQKAQRHGILHEINSKSLSRNRGKYCNNTNTSGRHTVTTADRKAKGRLPEIWWDTRRDE